MNRKTIKKTLGSRAALHVYFWVAIIALFLIEPPEEDVSYGQHVTRTIVIMSVAMLAVYVHFRILELFLLARRYLIYAPLAIVIVCSAGLLGNLAGRYLAGYVTSMAHSFMFVAYMVFFTSMIKLARAGFVQRMTMQEIREKQLHTELELLKAQINPHFLFNTLNNIFGMVRRVDERAAGGIATLSHLMRYMIHESNVERVGLRKEVEQLQRIIDLNMLRFSSDDDIDIRFREHGDVDSLTIPPMLLIPFVENAFKHGVRMDRTSFVLIELDVSGGAISFTVRNSIHERASDSSGRPGQGLANVRRRLELLYPQSHELRVERSKTEHVVILTIDQTGA